MKFLADMGISPRTVTWLRKQGYDAVHLNEQGLERLSDEAILSKARKEERVVLTLDLDFSYLLAIS
jgi:predicted nuclease of predicted toxin-antitoxin system